MSQRLLGRLADLTPEITVSYTDEYPSGDMAVLNPDGSYSYLPAAPPAPASSAAAGKPSGQTAGKLSAWLKKNSTAVYATAGGLGLLAVLKAARG
jgi:hypothetical protein